MREIHMPPKIWLCVFKGIIILFLVGNEYYHYNLNFFHPYSKLCDYNLSFPLTHKDAKSENLKQLILIPSTDSDGRK